MNEQQTTKFDFFTPIEVMYEHFDNPDDGRDSWDIAADIVNVLVTREQFPSDAGYYYHVYEVVRMVMEYVASTHLPIIEASTKTQNRSY